MYSYMDVYIYIEREIYVWCAPDSDGDGKRDGDGDDDLRPRDDGGGEKCGSSERSGRAINFGGLDFPFCRCFRGPWTSMPSREQSA